MLCIYGQWANLANCDPIPLSMWPFWRNVTWVERDAATRNTHTSRAHHKAGVLIQGTRVSLYLFRVTLAWATFPRRGFVRFHRDCKDSLLPSNSILDAIYSIYIRSLLELTTVIWHGNLTATATSHARNHRRTWSSARDGREFSAMCVSRAIYFNFSVDHALA